jgi:SAM-dependent methyltransferase
VIGASLDDYSRSSEAWEHGPARLVYDELARQLVAMSPLDLAGRTALDLGAGTGAASRALAAAGASTVAVDGAIGMLRWDRANRPACAAGEATNLPFAGSSFDAVVASFCFNHLDEPAIGVHEAGRVAKPDGVVLASTYAEDDDHPVKEAVHRALAELGWVAPGWYARLKAAMAAWGTVDAATAAIERGGLRPLVVERREVAFPELSPSQVVDTRLGIAHIAPFVGALDPSARLQVQERALELLGPRAMPLVRRVIFLAAR